MIDMDQRILDWHQTRFPNATMDHVALKICEEAGEVAKAILGLVGKSSATGGGNVPEEVADVLIACSVLMSRWFPDVNFYSILEAKITKLETKGAHPSSSIMPCCDLDKTRGPNIRGVKVCPIHCSVCGHDRIHEDYYGFCSECKPGDPCSEDLIKT